MNRRSFWLPLAFMLLLSILVQLVLPWWSMAVVGLLAGFMVAQTGRQAFGSGFWGAALSWLLPAIWLNTRNDGLLARRVAELLPLGGSPTVLLLVTAVLAGLVGGLAALAGRWLREAIEKPTPVVR